MTIQRRRFSRGVAAAHHRRLATGRLNAGATFSPIATARCAATCGPERHVKAKGILLVSARWPGAALYSVPLPRKHEPAATISGKSLTSRTGTMTVLSSLLSTVPAIPCAPHARGRDRFPARRKRCPERSLSPKEYFRTSLQQPLHATATPRRAVGFRRRVL
jgi:hypothetical protein